MKIKKYQSTFVLVAVLSVLLTAGAVFASTTIGTNITTGGSITASSALVGDGVNQDIYGQSVGAIMNIHKTLSGISGNYIDYVNLQVATILNPLTTPANFSYGLDSSLLVPEANSTDFTSEVYANTGYIDFAGSGDSTKLYGGWFGVEKGGAGTATNVYGSLNRVSNYGLGTITNAYGSWIDSIANSGGGAVTNGYGLYIDSQSAATNNYAMYYNGPGNVVWRLKGDGVVASYNPSFSPKYTAGATDYERIVTQWNSDVAEIGTEAGGTGTLRPLRLLGSSVDATAYKVGGTAGLTQTINTRKADNSGTCTITVVSGLITATTCP
jgi:hypothetical protein